MFLLCQLCFLLYRLVVELEWKGNIRFGSISRQKKTTLRPHGCATLNYQRLCSTIAFPYGYIYVSSAIIETGVRKPLEGYIVEASTASFCFQRILSCFEPSAVRCLVSAITRSRLRANSGRGCKASAMACSGGEGEGIHTSVAGDTGKERRGYVKFATGDRRLSGGRSTAIRPSSTSTTVSMLGLSSRWCWTQQSATLTSASTSPSCL